MIPTLEVCVENLLAAQTAARAGAGRIELCGTLAEGGLGPSLGILEQTLATVTIPVHVMVRPRSGDFCYSASELRAMERDITDARKMGAAAVVLGVLTTGREIDVATMRSLVEQARPMRVTFHRAFDVVSNLDRALEDVIATGADILLTSGGADRLPDASGTVARLVHRAGKRIQIMGGSGVTVGNAASLCAATGIAAIHGSFRRPLRRSQTSSRHLLPGAPLGYELHEEDVRGVVNALQQLTAEPAYTEAS